METVFWKVLGLMSLIFAFIAMVIGIVAMDKAGTTPTPKAETTSPYKPPDLLKGDFPASCRDVSGPSGLYMLKPNSKQMGPAFQTYCDMDSDGGGWTLVASVHENNINGKCTPGDKWSSEQGGSDDPKGGKNWGNINVFGQIEAITNQDYKNAAYYSVNASNVMVWHVPNGNKIYEVSKAATLKYYTSNNILANRGGTLQDLYSQHLPLGKALGGLYPILAAINESTSITSQVTDWWNYRYDGGRSNNQIRDGGRDMFDGGNRVFYRILRDNFTQIVYNTPYILYGSGVEVSSSTSYPFVAFAWVGQGVGTGQSNIDGFEFQVVSNYGADGGGRFSTYDYTAVSRGHMNGMYTAFNVYNAFDPSICEVFFYIYSAAIWNSVVTTTNMTRIEWSSTTASAINTVRVSGSPRNVLIGYTLLSKVNGDQVTTAEIEAVLHSYMDLASRFSFSVTVPHIVASITYIKGSNETVMAGIPTQHKDKVDPGFIQFRAFNSIGLPNALCPGVQVMSDNPEQMCIGGPSTALRDINQCGDFAGWGGAQGDRGSQDAPSDTGKSLNDINSTILLFTR